MGSSLLYLFTLFFSTLMMYLSDKGKTVFDQRFLTLLAFILVTIPSAIRYDVGTDYLNYVGIYHSIEYFQKSIEPAFYLLNVVLNGVGAHFQWVFTISAFLFSTLAFKSYPKRDAWIVHLLFFSMFLFYSFNIVRQAIAISFCLFAISKFIKKAYLSYIILCLIGFLFHSSALLIIFLGIIARLPTSRNFQTSTAPLLFASILILTFLLSNVVIQYINVIIPYLGLADYNIYFSGKYFVGRENATGLTVLFWILFSFYVFFNIKPILELNKNYWILIIMIFLYSFTSILAFNIIIFSRAAIYFALAPVLLCYVLWQLPKNKSLNRLVVGLVLLFTIYSFIKSSLPTEGDNPRKISPYQTIFSQSQL